MNHHEVVQPGERRRRDDGEDRSAMRNARQRGRAGWRNRLVGLPAVDERIDLVDFEPGHERSELAAGPARSPELKPFCST